MSWSTPRTWVTSETVTAAIMNAHVRDQFRETSPFTVTTAGDLSYADGANSMNSRVAIGAAHGMLVSTGSAPVWRIPATDVSTASETSDSTSYITLADAGLGTYWQFATEIEVTVTTGTAAVVLFGCEFKNDGAGNVTYLSFSVSGATTTAASDSWACFYESGAANDRSEHSSFRMPTLTAGSNTFTLEGKVNAGTGTIAHPRIVVIPL